MKPAKKKGQRSTLGGRSDPTRKPLYPSTPERPCHCLKGRNAPSRGEGLALSGLVARTEFLLSSLHELTTLIKIVATSRIATGEYKSV